jgi:hypothetical protein
VGADVPFAWQKPREGSHARAASGATSHASRRARYTRLGFDAVARPMVLHDTGFFRQVGTHPLRRFRRPSGGVRHEIRPEFVYQRHLVDWGLPVNRFVDRRPL